MTRNRGVNIEGKRFGKLTVLRRVGSDSRNSLWEAVCDCGNIVIRPRYKFTSQNSPQFDITAPLNHERYYLDDPVQVGKARTAISWEEYLNNDA